MKPIPHLVFLFLFSLNFAQVQKDTAFTLRSEMVKVARKFPSAKLVKIESSEKVQEIINIEYQQLQGRSLFLDAFLGNSTHRNPAVLLIHGGGWKSGSKEMMYALARSISQKGFNCFAVEYRLSGEAEYPAAIYDVVNAISYVKENATRFHIDKNQISLLGTSSGGQIAALIGAKYPDLVHSVIDIDGILAFHHPQSKEGESAEKWLGGTFEQNPEIWKDASPLTHAEKVKIPYLFINSQFGRFHAGQDEMVGIFRKNKIRYEIKTIENSPHTFWMFDPWFDPAIDHILKFLNDQFKN